MTSTDFSKLLSTLGGTLSARALGGPQAAQRFLEGQNQQEERRLQRNHEAAQQSRQQLFQLTRDRMQVEAQQEARAYEQGKLDDRQKKGFEHDAALQRSRFDQEKRILDAKNAFTRLTNESQQAHERAQALQQHIFAIERGDIEFDQTIDLEGLRQRHALARDEANNAARALEAYKARDFQAGQANIDRLIDIGKTAFKAFFDYRQSREAAQRVEDENARNRQHDIDMAERAQKGRVELKQMDLDLVEKEDRKAAMARAKQSYFALVNGSQAARDEATAMIYKMMPELGVPNGSGGIEYPEIDWNNPKATTELIYEAHRAGGFVAQVVTDRVEQKTSEAQELANMTGDTVPYTTQSDFLKTQQQFNNARRVISQANTYVQGLEQTLTSFGDTTFNTLDEANAELDSIGQEVVKSANDIQALAGQFGNFLGEGAGLTTEYQLLANSQAALSNSLYAASRNVASEFIGSWTYENADENPLFYRTPAGDFKYADEFDRLNNGPAMRQKSQAQDETMKNIVSIPDAHVGQGYANLTPAQQKLRQQLIDYQTENGNLSAQSINRQVMRLLQEGKNNEAQSLLDMLSGAAEMQGGLSAMEQSVAQGVQKDSARAAMRDFGFTLKSTLGLDVVPDDAAADAIMAAHGIRDATTGQMRPPMNDRETEQSVASWMTSDEGSNLIIDRIADKLVLDPNSTATRQGKRMLDKMLSQANMSQNAAVRDKLVTKLEDRFGTNRIAEINNTAELASELHSQVFGDVELFATGNIGSSRQMMDPSERFKLDNDYVSAVFGDTAADLFVGRTRDEVVRDFFRRAGDERPAFKQPVAGFFDSSAVGGGLLNYSEYKDAAAQAMELGAEVRSTLGDRADFRDVHDLHMDMDPLYQSYMQRPGLLWIQGRNAGKALDAKYLTGDESLRAQYLSRTPRPNDEIVQRLDKLDFFRARNLNSGSLKRFSNAERAILGQEQAFYRSMSLNDAIAAFGPDGSGVKFDDIGMFRADPSLEQDAAQADQVVDPFDAMDVKGVLTRAALAEDEVNTKSMLPFELYDLTLGPNGYLVGPLTETHKKNALNDIANVRKHAEAIGIVRDSEIRRTAIPRLASAIKPEDLLNKEALATAAVKKFAEITGQSQQILAQTFGPADSILESIQEAETYTEAFDNFWNLVSYGAAAAAENKTTISIAGTTQQEHRNLLIKAVRLGFGNVKDEVNLITSELQRRKRDGDLSYDKMPSRIKDGLTQDVFNTLVEQVEDFRDPDQIKPFAFALWLNHSKRYR